MPFFHYSERRLIRRLCRREAVIQAGVQRGIAAPKLKGWDDLSLVSKAQLKIQQIIDKRGTEQ